MGKAKTSRSPATTAPTYQQISISVEEVRRTSIERKRRRRMTLILVIFPTRLKRSSIAGRRLALSVGLSQRRQIITRWSEQVR